MSSQEIEKIKEIHITIYENMARLFNARNSLERCLIVKARHIVYNLNMLKGEQLEAYILELNRSVELLLNQAERKTA